MGRRYKKADIAGYQFLIAPCVLHESHKYYVVIFTWPFEKLLYIGNMYLLIMVNIGPAGHRTYRAPVIISPPAAAPAPAPPILPNPCH